MPKKKTGAKKTAEAADEPSLSSACSHPSLICGILAAILSIALYFTYDTSLLLVAGRTKIEVQSLGTVLEGTGKDVAHRVYQFELALNGVAVLAPRARYSEWKQRHEQLKAARLPQLPTFPSMIMDATRDMVHNDDNVARRADELQEWLQATVGLRKSSLDRPEFISAMGFGWQTLYTVYAEKHCVLSSALNEDSSPLRRVMAFLRATVVHYSASNIREGGCVKGVEQSLAVSGTSCVLAVLAVLAILYPTQKTHTDYDHKRQVPARSPSPLPKVQSRQQQQQHQEQQHQQHRVWGQREKNVADAAAAKRAAEQKMDNETRKRESRNVSKNINGDPQKIPWYRTADYSARARARSPVLRSGSESGRAEYVKSDLTVFVPAHLCGNKSGNSCAKGPLDEHIQERIFKASGTSENGSHEGGFSARGGRSARDNKAAEAIGASSPQWELQLRWSGDSLHMKDNLPWPRADVDRLKLALEAEGIYVLEDCYKSVMV
jgi:hypothetical protein